MAAILSTNCSSSCIIHGNAILLKQKIGLLILGDAQSGKSELCAQLIQHGHQLIADDAVSLSIAEKRVIAKAPPQTHNLMHLRSTGIIQVRSHFGESALIDEAAIMLAVQLSATPTSNSYSVLNHDIPQITIPLLPRLETFVKHLQNHVDW